MGAALLALGCAPTEEVYPVHPITEPPITEQEIAEGRNDPGNDRVEPWPGIDGDVAHLAPATQTPAEGSSDEGVQCPWLTAE